MLVERLSLQTGKSVEYIIDFSRSAGIKYKEFLIEKKTGGFRIIEQPARSVKSVQRWLTRSLFDRYIIHPSAMGYRRNISIRDNAVAHSASRYTLRMDFSDFFWSFTSGDVRRFFEIHQPDGVALTALDVEFIVGMVSRRGRLAMGAPSSPILTNIMMYKLDCDISETALRLHSIYTRYADDLFLSSNIAGQLDVLKDGVERCVRRIDSPTLTINPDKTRYLSRKYHREITGLVITPQGEVSLGRDRKRMLKSLVHRALSGSLAAEERGVLAGHLNWTAAVDPTFLKALYRKYGVENVTVLRRG